MRSLHPSTLTASAIVSCNCNSCSICSCLNGRPAVGFSSSGAVRIELCLLKCIAGTAEAPGWGARGQGPLLKDVHCALLRLMEGLDEDIQEAPTLAGYGSAADLGPQEAYRSASIAPTCSRSWRVLSWALGQSVSLQQLAKEFERLQLAVRRM